MMCALFRILALASLGVWFLGSACQAHPHILVKARTHVLVSAQGNLTGVEQIWDFDKAFSAFAIQGYDSKQDGMPSRQDLQKLAQINMESLADYKFFSQIKINGETIELADPTDFYDIFKNETLELHFTLHPKTPILVKGRSFELNVYDPDYFAAVSFAKADPVEVSGLKVSCTIKLHRPGILDPLIAAKVAVIPATQRDLPPDLFAATAQLINGALISCPAE